MLYPKIRLQHLPALLKHAAIGALLAGVYGIVHDQIVVRVAYIHNASYLGGFAGLIVAMVYVHKSGPAAGMPPGRSLGLERVSQIGPSSTRP